MALKMRFLYYSKKAKIKAMAEIVKAEFDLTQNHNAIDIIPPAYSCENERLVILAVSGKGEPEDLVRRFCSELNKKKAQNIALLVDGDEKLANKLLDTLVEAGSNVNRDVLYFKIGGLPFLGGKVTEEEKAKLLEELALYLTSYECQMERFNEFEFGASNLQAQVEIEDLHFGIAALHKQAEFAIPQRISHGAWWDIAKMLGIATETAKTYQDLKDALDQYDSEIDGLFVEKPEWSIIGAVCGTVWDVDFPLTKVADNIYESDPLHMKAGDEFLIRKDQNWEMYFGYHGIYGGNFKIENDGEYLIRITVISEYEINVEILPVE